MTAAAWTASDDASTQTQVPLPVQILTTIFYAGFAISVSIVAMAMFGLIGILLAVLFAWQWTRLAALNAGIRWESPCATKRDDTPPLSPTGNASFDAYRADQIARLEQERQDFETFLQRLRAAKDKSEFDQFMADHPGASQPQAGDDAPKA